MERKYQLQSHYAFGNDYASVGSWDIQVKVYASSLVSPLQQEGYLARVQVLTPMTFTYPKPRP